MRETFLFMAGAMAGALIFPAIALIRELYWSSEFRYRCECCGDLAGGYDEDLGPICAECEVIIFKLEKLKLNLK